MNNNDMVSKPKYGPFYSRKRKRKMANPILCCIPETQCTEKKKKKTQWGQYFHLLLNCGYTESSDKFWIGIGVL